MRRTLQDKGAELDCPACGQNAWAYVVPGFGKLDLETFEYKQMTVAPMICEECGFLKLHHIQTLMGEPAPETPLEAEDQEENP